MPPFVPLADGAQVELIGVLGSVVVENRLWFISRQPPITQQQVDDLASGVYSWYTGQILPYLSDQYQFQIVVANDWTASPAPFQGLAGPPTVGGNASGVHSANVSVRVSFKGSSAQTFPNNSNFIPAIPLDAVNGNVYSATFRTAMFNGYVNLIDLASGFGPFPAWRWVITSQRLNLSWRSTQAFARMDFVRFPSPWVSPRRRRLHP